MKKLCSLLLILTTCLALSACSKNAFIPTNTPEEPPIAASEPDEPGSDTDENSNTMVANTSWIARDKSCMVFMEDDRYAWYQTKEITDDNYYAGTYQLFLGEAALKHLTVDLEEYGVTEDEMQQVFDKNEEYSLENFVCMTIENDSFMLNGEEQLDQNKEVSYFGFLLQDGTYLDIANMTTGTYYGFTKEQA